MDRLRVVLYGGSVLLGTLGASLRRFEHLDIVSLATPPPGSEPLAALAPDVILFDVGAAFPQPAFALLQRCPNLRLIGLDPDRNRAVVWSARQLNEPSLGELVRIIDDGNRNLETHTAAA